MDCSAGLGGRGLLRASAPSTMKNADLGDTVGWVGRHVVARCKAPAAAASREAVADAGRGYRSRCADAARYSTPGPWGTLPPDSPVCWQTRCVEPGSTDPGHGAWHERPLAWGKTAVWAGPGGGYVPGGPVAGRGGGRWV